MTIQHLGPTIYSVVHSSTVFGTWLTSHSILANALLSHLQMVEEQRSCYDKPIVVTLDMLRLTAHYKLSFYYYFYCY